MKRIPCPLFSGHISISASQTQEQVLLCYMNFHDGIEPYKFSLSLRNDVIEIVLLYRRQGGCVYCVTELVGLVPLRQLSDVALGISVRL